MSKQSRNNARPRHPRSAAPPSGLRTGLLALTGVGLAVAGVTWITLGADSFGPSATQAQPSASAAPATQPPAASAPVARAAAQSAASAGATTAASAQPQTASTPAASVASPVAAGQQAFVDPATGKLRPAEHDDVAALNAKGAAGARRLARTAQVANEPQEFPTEGGAMGIAVPDEVMPYTVATKTPDGRVVIEHVTGSKAATKKVQENTKNGGMVQRKGESNDR
jgi:hypothetical protein